MPVSYFRDVTLHDEAINRQSSYTTYKKKNHSNVKYYVERVKRQYMGEVGLIMPVILQISRCSDNYYNSFISESYLLY